MLFGKHVWLLYVINLCLLADFCHPLCWGCWCSVRPFFDAQTLMSQTAKRHPVKSMSEVWWNWLRTYHSPSLNFTGSKGRILASVNPSSLWCIVVLQWSTHGKYENIHLMWWLNILTQSFRSPLPTFTGRSKSAKFSLTSPWGTLVLKWSDMCKIWNPRWNCLSV